MPLVAWRASSKPITNNADASQPGAAICCLRFFLPAADGTVATLFSTIEYFMPSKRLLLLPFCALLLTACGEPSEADLKSAVEKSLTQANQVTSMVLGDKGKIEVVAVHKLGCDKKEGAYACTIEVETKLPLVGSQRKTQQVIIANGQQGWVLVE
jgi:hypothetical protein